MLDLPSTHVGERKLVSNQVQPTQLHPEAKAKNGNFSSKSKMSIHLRATFIGAYLVSAVGSLFLFNVLYGDQAYGTVSMEGLSFSAPFETTNPIMKENMMQGTSDWILTNPSLKREIEGYMSHTSVQRGESILLFYNTKSPSVIVEVFRSGYYGGLGARKVLGPVEVPGREQIIPRPDNYGTVSCQWKDPFIVSTQNSWTTGVYLHTTIGAAVHCTAGEVEDQRNYLGVNMLVTERLKSRMIDRTQGATHWQRHMGMEPESI
mmetsp:Transcript_25949/g.54670  ORF Transcript_25949/g.54670 Transcript_25949/m.54670 type:complete len:262 (+) Transcript_25949:94-879(+)